MEEQSDASGAVVAIVLSALVLILVATVVFSVGIYYMFQRKNHNSKGTECLPVIVDNILYLV